MAAHAFVRKPILCSAGASNKGKTAKTALNILPVEFPKYSPDLLPLDYGVWDELERRVSAQRVKGYESVDAFKKTLRLLSARLAVRLRPPRVDRADAD